MFPRDIALAALSHPVHVELIAELTPDKIDEWLYRQLHWSRAAVADHRRLRGCLVAHRGRALIFLEATETEAERRFTLSHELAHFIGHYLAARNKAIARLGPSVAAILDGDRAPTAAERLSGVFAGCPMGVFRDVLDRNGGEPLTAVAERMEKEANAAAFQALAPPVDVVAQCKIVGRAPDRAGILETLKAYFGLACADATYHLPVVLDLVRRQAPTLVESLKAAALASGKGRERSIKD
jgi:hypothetical protein